MLDIFINALFPPRCIFCGELLKINNKINVCEKCRLDLPFLEGAIFKVDGFADGVICLLEYTEMVRRCIAKYKFYNRPAFYRTLAKMLSEELKTVTKCVNFDIIISIPLHIQKERKRGYNQSYLISRYLGKELCIPEGSRFISRVVNNSSQSHLDRHHRQTNIKGVFKVNFPEKIKGKKVLLVDDIFTTGSTLDECARVLKNAGAVIVIGAVIATGRKNWVILNNTKQIL